MTRWRSICVCLHVREELLHEDALVRGTARHELLQIMEQNTETIMPGFHPSAEGTAGHARASHGGAYFEMFKTRPPAACMTSTSG